MFRSIPGDQKGERPWERGNPYLGPKCSIFHSKLCMDHRNKIKVPNPVVKDLTSKK